MCIYEVTKISNKLHFSKYSSKKTRKNLRIADLSHKNEIGGCKKQNVPMAKCHRYDDMRFDVIDYFTNTFWLSWM